MADELLAFLLRISPVHKIVFAFLMNAVVIPRKDWEDYVMYAKAVSPDAEQWTTPLLNLIYALEKFNNPEDKEDATMRWLKDQFEKKD